MKHLLASVVALALAGTTVQAHFIWIVPDKNGATAQVMFSEIPEPDSPKCVWWALRQDSSVFH